MQKIQEILKESVLTDVELKHLNVEKRVQQHVVVEKDANGRLVKKEDIVVNPNQEEFPTIV
mgnify:CR=1 FL=1